MNPSLLRKPPARTTSRNAWQGFLHAALIVLLIIGPSIAGVAAGNGPWPDDGVRASQNLMPHFEAVNGRQILYVDGLPFTVLAVEIPWMDLIYGKYAETMSAYDDLYPAAASMSLNALKVPVKWSMVEPKPGVYDFTYVDHAKSLAEKNHVKLILNWFGHYASGDGTIYRNLTGEVFAPLDIIKDEKTYPRAVDGNGVVHHNAASYEYDAIINREVAAFRAFMGHIKKVDSETHTILMIQVENEIAVFGADRRNRSLWRDHSAVSNKLFAEKGFTDDLKYSAWRLSSNWIRRVTEAGAEVYPLPFFHNYVGGKLEDAIVGGAPGEDVATYLANCPRIDFIGLNLYISPESSVDDFRSALNRYRVSRNLPAITETNSDRSPVAPRLAYIAIGEFGAPIFAPWALNISYPTLYQPYVLKDGTLANGAFALHECYESLSMALPQISTYAGTEKLKVFMARFPGDRFSQTEDVDGAKVNVSGDQNGQVMVIHLGKHDFLMVGYRCNVTLWDPSFVWPALQKIRVERGRFVGKQWQREGEPDYTINQSDKSLDVGLDTPQVVRVSW
jgi:hypothetical protein